MTEREKMLQAAAEAVARAWLHDEEIAARYSTQPSSVRSWIVASNILAGWYSYSLDPGRKAQDRIRAGTESARADAEYRGMSNDKAFEEAEKVFLRAMPMTPQEEHAAVLANMARLRSLRLAKEAEEPPPKKRFRI
jgi:hypothetical protein